MLADVATSVDNLSILIVQRCFREFVIFLQRIFIASLRLGVFPTQWKTAKVIALGKPGKKSYSEARAYRPISLLNHMGKLLESIMNTRLKNWLEKSIRSFSHFTGDFIVEDMPRALAGCWLRR